MSSCSLGVNAFRSGVQAAAHHLTKSWTGTCTRFLPATPSSTRCLSYWPSSQRQRQQQRGGHDRNAAAAVPALLRTARPVLPQWVGIRTLIGGQDVTTHYVDLPPNYTDKEGLPFAKKDLETMEVLTIFGPNISTASANKLLRILHGRRVAGTLEDPILRANTTVYGKEHLKVALQYLRHTVPVDEVINAGLRAEDELAVLENGGFKKSKKRSDELGYTARLKLYKDGSSTSRTHTVYGPSALDAIREQNKAKWEARQKQREEEQKKREEEERYGKAGPLQVAGKPQTRQLSVKMQEYMRRGQSDLKEPPKMKKWERLLPSTIIVAAVVGLCLAYAEFYQPAKRENRLFPDIPPSAVTVGTLILANILGWGLWKIPPLWGFLNKHFLLVTATPRVSTMLTAMFSHQSSWHLLQNMAFLWLLGVRLHDDVGRGTFLATYFASGTVAALGTLTYAVLKNRLTMTSLGASGAIYGVCAAYLWLHRFEHFRILGLPPPPREGAQGLTIMAFFAALNIAGIFTGGHLTRDITSHLVGMCTGVLAAHFIEQKKEARQPLEEKESKQPVEVTSPQ